MKNRKTKEKQLLKALEECWYLNKEDKQFWLDNISELPNQTLLNVLDSIKESNKIMNSCIKAALKANPENNYLKQITNKINQIKAKAFAIEEEEDKETLEEDLEKQMENL